MGDFWEDSTNCPLCGKSFFYTKVKYDSIVINKYDDDLKPNFKGPNPQNFSILTCPKCGFTFFSDDINVLKRIKKEKKEELKEYLKIAKLRLGKIDNSYEKSSEFIKKQLALASIIYKIIENPENMAKSLIRLAWIFRDENKEKEELKMIYSAVNYLEEKFKDLTTDEELIMYYFYKGYLNLRLGKKKDAKESFNKLISRYKNSSNPYIKKAEYLKGDL
ncbi:DUF2225 domain-containing protein [Marinitoga sp. 38H-ov]|uniref:DUF2225 domain-containing protein n=1 Tax=Marinitoga sp. 38H-ov TaxID=1755814 RepID=UPI0013EA6AA6|nr:DUF2225 domain-containing protein [Marinitoga sp. 38H-ov]KAF2956080.1 hypothetical protein AS160_07920 [Marinitoga sp. 38H-ov]